MENVTLTTQLSSMFDSPENERFELEMMVKTDAILPVLHGGSFYPMDSGLISTKVVRVYEDGTRREDPDFVGFVPYSGDNTTIDEDDVEFDIVDICLGENKESVEIEFVYGFNWTSPDGETVGQEFGGDFKIVIQNEELTKLKELPTMPLALFTDEGDSIKVSRAENISFPSDYVFSLEGANLVLSKAKVRAVLDALRKLNAQGASVILPSNVEFLIADTDSADDGLVVSESAETEGGSELIVDKKVILSISGLTVSIEISAGLKNTDGEFYAHLGNLPMYAFN